jgi:hypothetical protein
VEFERTAQVLAGRQRCRARAGHLAPLPGGPVAGEGLLDPRQRKLAQHAHHARRSAELPALVDVHHHPLAGPKARKDGTQRGEIALLAEADLDLERAVRGRACLVDLRQGLRIRIEAARVDRHRSTVIPAEPAPETGRLRLGAGWYGKGLPRAQSADHAPTFA